MNTEEKKKKLEKVLFIDMSPEESVYESNLDEDHEGKVRMMKLVVKQVEWRSDELTRGLKSLDIPGDSNSLVKRSPVQCMVKEPDELCLSQRERNGLVLHRRLL